MIAAASGKAGGVVAARNRYGSYLRGYVIPVNPRSTRQMTLRSRMADVTSKWNQILTGANRDSWNTYASNTPIQGRNGSINTVTGFNHFVRSAQALLEAGVAIKASAPGLYTLPETDPTLAVSASAATNNLSVTFNNTAAWAGESGGYMLLYLGKPQVNNRNFFNGPWRYAGKITGATPTPPTSPATVASPFTLVAGQKLWVYARVMRADGRLSNPFRVGPVTVAA